MTTNSIAIIRLNVGGQHFITTRATLCAVEGSLLACMFCLDSNFAPPIENEGKEVFLDRNPIAFGSILDYLRDGCRVMVDLPSNNNEEALLQRLRTDADYFGLDGLVLYCDTKLRIIIEKQCDQRDNAANAAKLIKKQCNELDNAAKLVNYLYVQNSDEGASVM
ncbi:POZ domain-containing protein [Fragilariopsis cylindrus CCMP1102]|uniref:POZ domain-containing protein n=1 Tax=Fragilariopsis cylindrus CCMP1102 TaxID=635003 RepID=A0A1E7FI85_9STRA|nr:POZ domain-containing protein [Fragilariopsis cylindrus CCMP1102]|eukprot:OEU17886.1 POZ domain-containing protein [Fragilariopsis cylindrus CCMP1102]